MSFHRTVRVLAIVVVTAGSAALGQSKGPGASNNGGSRGTGTGTAPPTTQTLPGQLNQLIMVSGKVITADGSPLPEPVALEQVCNGHVMRRGRSDFRGYFSVDIGRSFFPS